MGTPSEDLAEGYSKVVSLRAKTLARGGTEAEFMENALGQEVSDKNRFIMENFWNYDLTLWTGE